MQKLVDQEKIDKVEYHYHNNVPVMWYFTEGLNDFTHTLILNLRIKLNLEITEHSEFGSNIPSLFFLSIWTNFNLWVEPTLVH